MWRVFAALCYLVPWIDSISFGREIYRRFRNLLVLYLVPGPLAKVYFSSQFAPLIIFFVLFLAVVKNKKLHHFVRFNCMQAIMLDIVIMLCHIVKAYLPAEIKWSVIAHLVDMGMWYVVISYRWFCCLSGVVWRLSLFSSPSSLVSHLSFSLLCSRRVRAGRRAWGRSCMRCSGRFGATMRTFPLCPRACIIKWPSLSMPEPSLTELCKIFLQITCSWTNGRRCLSNLRHE